MFLGLSFYFILMDFYLYGFFGWIYESCFVSIRDHKRVNRGFLIGPLIPLYGFGGTLVYLFLRPLAKYPSLLFIGGMILASVIEYITSLLMEKVFHAQWWDYSKEPYNFQGRVALIPSMFWGVLSLLAFDFLQPGISKIIDVIPQTIGNYLLVVLISLTVADIIYSVITSLNFSRQLEKIYQFRVELEQLLEESSFKDLLDNISLKTKNLTDRMDEFREALSKKKAEVLENDSTVQSIESKFQEYKKRNARILNGNFFLGTKRIFHAFPTMKFHPSGQKKRRKNSTSINVRDLLIQLTKTSQKEENQDEN